MEIEIQGIPQSLRPSYQARIKASKADLTRYKKLSKDIHSQLSRSELLARPGMGGAPTSDEPYGASDRTRLLAGTALLEDYLTASGSLLRRKSRARIPRGLCVDSGRNSRTQGIRCVCYHRVVQGTLYAIVSPGPFVYQCHISFSHLPFVFPWL